MATNGSKPGLLSLVTALVRAPLERRLLEAELFKGERLLAQTYNQQIANFAQVVQPDADEANWKLIGQAGTRDLDTGPAGTLRDQARKAALFAPHLSGYLNTLLRFVMGEGPTLSVEHTSPTVQEACTAHWKKFRIANKWDELEDEIPYRLWRDGEFFVRTFDQLAPAEIALDVRTALTQAKVTVPLAFRGPDWPVGVAVVRLVPPEQISDPTSGKVSGGIVTAAKDVQQVLGYLWVAGDQVPPQFIPADQMLHKKIRVDADIKRGRSLLEPLLPVNANYEKWLQYRILLNYMRSAVVWVKKVANATPAQLAALRATQQTQREDGQNDRQVRAFKPGTTVTTTGDVDYDFKNPNLNAQDARYDGRSILLSMAAATGMPEYIFTGDASNANFASTLVAEGPAVREFQAWQDSMNEPFIWVYRRNLVLGARMKQIPGLTEDEAREIPIAVEWPPLQSRNELQHTQRNAILLEKKVLSKEGMAKDEGIDWDTEQERLAKEQADAPPPPGDPDAERDDGSIPPAPAPPGPPAPAPPGSAS